MLGPVTWTETVVAMLIAVGLNTVIDKLTDWPRDEAAGAVNRSVIDGAGVPVMVQEEVAELVDPPNTLFPAQLAWNE